MRSLALLAIMTMATIVSTAELQCPSYSCSDSKDHCVKVSTVGEADKRNKTVELSKCENQTWYCNYENNFWTEDSYQAKCKEPQPTPTGERYPGEPCKDNSTCSGDWICVEDKCTGKKVNETCASNAECLAGNWCQPAAEQGGNKTCQGQVAVGGNCTTEFQCANNAFCYDGKCTEYFTLETNTTIKEKVQLSSYACKSTRAVLDTEQNTKCVETKYVKNATDGVVECKSGEMCEYDIGSTSNLQLGCVCGYNAEGKGYCPYDFASSPSRYTNVGTAWRSAFNNKCHTLNRFSCPEADLSDVYEKISEQQVAYHKAVDCARAVLNAGYLAISILAFIAFLI